MLARPWVAPVLPEALVCVSPCGPPFSEPFQQSPRVGGCRGHLRSGSRPFPASAGLQLYQLQQSASLLEGFSDGPSNCYLLSQKILHLSQ